MSSWEHFPVFEERPSGVRIFTEKERAELEFVIATQIVTMLSDYATCNPVEVDHSDCIDIEDYKSYYALELEPVAMENDGELIIQQLPYSGNGFDASTGLHCVEVVDEDDVMQMQFACWDPDLDVERRIYDPVENKHIPQPVLQELYEALVVCSYILAHTGEVNRVPHETSAYPIPVVEPEFEQLISDF